MSILDQVLSDMADQLVDRSARLRELSGGSGWSIEKDALLCGWLAKGVGPKEAAFQVGKEYGTAISRVLRIARRHGRLGLLQELQP
ncbi:MAG: hypothetical protein U0Q18_36995 [Bryobacteraceae bacterium]